MNPMTRKMFKSRDARTKLRGMGGILASSPELAQTVQQFKKGGNVDAGFGSNVEYTYSTFLAENNLNDTPQAREMFARYKAYMDTRDPLTDPQLFSSVGFDRAPAAPGVAPMTSAVEFDPNRRYSRPDMPSAPAGLAALSVEPDAAFTRQTSPAAPAAPQSTLDQLRSSVYSTGPLEAFGQAYGQQAEVFAPSNKAREDEKAFRAVGESFDNNALLSSGRAPSVLDELRGSVYSTSPLEAALAVAGPRLDQAFSREGMPSQTAADVAAEVALRNRERASENAGRLTSEELMSPDPVRPGAAPELTAEELAMQAYGESLGQQYAPIGENAEQVDQAVSEFFEFLGSPKVGSGAMNYPGAEGRAIMRGDLTAAEMMPPPLAPLPPPSELLDQELGMDYVPEGQTPVVEAPAADTATETPVVEVPAAGAATEPPATDTTTETESAAPVVTEEVVKKVADPKIQKKAVELAPSPGDTEDDLRAKYEARAKLFQEILGEDEAGARNKGMDLAMIGLAIMSGQSPNALTNIALGGAAGLKAMSARDEAARERQRLVRTTALESVLDEEAADKAAAADLAGRNFSRQTQLMVAQLRNTGVDLTEKAAILFNNTYNSTLEAEKGRGTKSAAVKSGEMTADQSAANAANAAVQNFLERFGAGSVLSVPGGQPPPSAVSSPQELEAAAKAAGRPTFVYNGMEYPVR